MLTPDLSSQHRPARHLHRRPLERRRAAAIHRGLHRRIDRVPKLQRQESLEWRGGPLGERERSSIAAGFGQHVSRRRDAGIERCCAVASPAPTNRPKAYERTSIRRSLSLPALVARQRSASRQSVPAMCSLSAMQHDLDAANALAARIDDDDFVVQGPGRTNAVAAIVASVTGRC